MHRVLGYLALAYAVLGTAPADLIAASAGGVVGWGSVVLPPTDSSNAFIGVAGGNLHTLALKSDRTIAAWGENSAGECSVPACLSNAIAVAAGYSHSMALTSDG